MAADLLRMTAPDGVSSDARLFRATADAPSLLVVPAMGVNARSYDRFGDQLAAAGVTALVMELRGGESSSLRPRPGVDFGYAELLSDVVLHVEHLRKTAQGPVHLLGHSLGGQLGTIGLARWFVPGARLVVIASGTVHYRAWRGLERVGLLAGTQLAQLIARGLGYYPGHRLGFGGKQSTSLIVDWSNAARTGVYASHRHGPLEHQLDALEPQVLALHVQGDTMAPRASTEALVRKLRRAHVTWLDVTPPREPRKQNPHFRWLKDPAEAARKVAAFLR